MHPRVKLALIGAILLIGGIAALYVVGSIVGVVIAGSAAVLGVIALSISIAPRDTPPQRPLDILDSDRDDYN